MISAIHISINEPQLEDSIKSIENKFDIIEFVNNVSPISEAYNAGIEGLKNKGVKDGWVVGIAGDMILYSHAREMINRELKYIYPNLAAIGFGLYDTFLHEIICCVWVQNFKIYSQIKRVNKLGQDSLADKEIKKLGFKKKVLYLENNNDPLFYTIGTHFNNPDEFQVFYRFRKRGTKALKNPSLIDKELSQLKNLYNNTKNELYKIAIQAYNYGLITEYPSSHDIRIDLEEYEDSKWRQMKF